jgi:hypothetical protein
MTEELLHGGNTHDAIVRVGDTVRRPTGPWTPGVHALLEHLERQRYEGAPRAFGLDDEGREVLEFVPGSVVWPDRFALVQTDSALAMVAATIRRYHDAVEDFRFDGLTWSERGCDPYGPVETVCHNDLAPWNLVQREGTGTWVFIDWDLAAPGRRAWDLALALLSFVPLMPDSPLTDEETRRRIALFARGYGRPLPTEILVVAVERCATEAERIESDGRAGIAPYARLLAEGHATIWRGAEAHIEARRNGWQPAVAQER